MSTTPRLAASTFTRFTRRALLPAAIAAGLVAAALVADPAAAMPMPIPPFEGVAAPVTATESIPAAVHAALEASPDHAQIQINQIVNELAMNPSL